MSIAFNRRTFLKTGAALVGATALMGLTGCDSSSSTSHPINKVVGKDQTFDVGGVDVEFGSHTTTNKKPYLEVEFYFTNSNANKVVSLYGNNFSAAYDGTVLNFLGLEDKQGVPINRIDIQKADGEVTVTAKFNGYPAQLKPEDYAKFAYKFHYNNQSILFSDNGTNTLTSGVYSDTTKL